MKDRDAGSGRPMPDTRMTIKRLQSGYWHVRLGANRFAQWQVGWEPSWADFFGMWTGREMDAAAGLARAELARDAF